MGHSEKPHPHLPALRKNHDTYVHVSLHLSFHLSAAECSYGMRATCALYCACRAGHGDHQEDFK